MPITKTRALKTEFEYHQPAGRKTMVATCRNCDHYEQAISASRQLTHLLKCPGYKGKERLVSSIPVIGQKRRRTLEVASRKPLHTDKKHQFDNAAAMAIYMGGRPFSLFDEPYIRQFVYQISGEIYNSPGREVLSNALLEECYADT